MKLPSLASLFRGAMSTFRRFPLAITCAVIGTGFGMVSMHQSYESTAEHFWYWNAIGSAYLGMLLQVATVVYAERRDWSDPAKMMGQLTAAVMALVYYYSLPDHFTEVGMIRFMLFSLALHWLIAFIPFTGRGEQNGFWVYNKELFLRILLSFLYSVVLYLGLALALLAIDNLFKAKVDGKVYGDLWFFLAGVFNTWFFLAGFPKDYAALDREANYPKGLKIFTQYILLPILVVYLGILYAYSLKIIFTAQWPVGWVSYLVLGFSVAGILSLLLIYPIRNEENNKWIPGFSRFFYFALFPLIILLGFAIERRVSDYGVTELRYFVLLLAAWLLFIALYFLLSRKKNIKLIPVSLCLLAFLSSFGPWSAFGVSRASQSGRLARLLNADKILEGGKVVKASVQPSFHDRKEISSVTEYLVEVHGYQVLQPYFTRDLDSLMRRDSLAYYQYVSLYSGDTRRIVDTLLSMMNITYLAQYETEDRVGNYYNYTRGDDETAVDIGGYNYFIGAYSAPEDGGGDSTCSTYRLGGDSINICFDTVGHRLLITSHADSPVEVNMDSVFHSMTGKSNEERNSMKLSDMTLYASHGAFMCKLVLKNMDGYRTDSVYRVSTFVADIFIGRKK